ncbi:MAG: S41 family peptidase [Planctomycetota bacterium JB042]
MTRTPPLRISLAASLAVSLATPDAAATDRAAYRKDVDFLLETLERKCGGFFDRKGIAWRKVEREFESSWKGVRSDVDHYRLVRRIVARVEDGHAGIVDVRFEWPEDEREPARKGVGLSLGVSGRDVVVKDCFGPAESAGVRSGWSVRSIDGEPALKWIEARAKLLRDTNGYSTDQAAQFAACHHGLADVPGTSWSFEFKDGRKSRKKTLTCASGGGNGVPIGPIFPPTDAVRIGRQSYGTLADGKIGWIHLRKVPEELPAQLDQMLGALGEVEGLVLDFRANGGGGVDHEAVFGRFLAPGEAYGPWKASADGAHYAGPIVVIVDAGTCSAGETLSGRLKSEKRAYVIGPSATSGMSGRKESFDLPSGLMTVRVTVSSFSAGDEIEGYGIEPHEIVAFDRDLQGQGIDPFLHRAVELLSDGLPKDVVRYRGR